MVNMALAAQPENASFLDTKGWILYQQQNFKEALPYLLESASTGAASATIYDHIGDTYFQLQEHNLARKAWQDALEIEPDRDLTRKKLNELLESK